VFDSHRMASLTRRKSSITVTYEKLPTRSTIALEATGPLLLSYHQIPLWYQDNDFILHGYRAESNSIRACWKSCFFLHNESVNIYTHLLPAIFSLLGVGWIGRYLEVYYPENTIADRILFNFFLLTATVCFGISASFHVLINHSGHSHLWLRLDFFGIMVHVLGYFVSGIYMIFYCEPTLQKIYWAMVRIATFIPPLIANRYTGKILTLGSVTILILVNPKLQGRRWRTFRVWTFVVTSLSGFVPLGHGIKLFGFAQMAKQSGILYYLGEGLLLAVGTFFYAVSTEVMRQVSRRKADQRNRCGSRKLLSQASSIFSDPPIRSFTYS
jgi:adiponectin receptor